MKKIVAIIPSRYGSSRFPGKPLALINNKPMIQWVYENVSKVDVISDIYVATDDERIYKVVNSFNGNAIMTASNHTCGTDRLAECIRKIHLDNSDIVLNIQGDEPLIRPEMIIDLIECFVDSTVYMGTLKKEIDDPMELNNPNVVKVISDANDYAIYFSRFPIPYERSCKTTHYKHIGVYGYTAEFLLKLSKMPKTTLEICESLEQLRVLENGYKIKVKETIFQTIGVDTPEQIIQVEKILGEL